MTLLKQRPLVELTEEAIQILYRELGIVDTVRFLRQFSPELGDYTETRAQQKETETLDEILDEIRTRRASPKTSYHERLAEIRSQYPRAYEKWTEAEDAQLSKEFRAGKAIQDLARLLDRQPRAIEIRLAKLGLVN